MSKVIDVSIDGGHGRSLDVEFLRGGIVRFCANSDEGSQSTITSDLDEIRKLHAALGEWLKEQEAANGANG